MLHCLMKTFVIRGMVNLTKIFTKNNMKYMHILKNKANKILSNITSLISLYENMSIILNRKLLLSGDKKAFDEMLLLLESKQDKDRLNIVK